MLGARAIPEAEIVRFEPLEEGENRKALERAASVKWQAFRYQAIVVPGAGLTGDERGLSAMGELRVRLAVRRYRQGLAPFIIVSGGNVHPDRTPYNESVEMKRALMKRYGVPASAILVDPYARHTTTNLRNAERLLFRAGARVGGDVLVTSSREQIDYIESPGFATRCQNELGYVPHAVSSRPSPFDLIVRLDIRSLHQDPLDPLDP